MSWIWKRFIDKWYKKSKYLLKIHWKTIIEKIISNFDIKNDFFLFICNETDYVKNDLYKLFDRLNIKYKLISIKNHKLWPAFSTLESKDFIDLDSPTIVNYCDFFWEWDYELFKQKIKNYDWGIICYKDFHPHLLHPNLYAWVKTNEKNELIELKEKFSYTENKMDTWQSSWTYYFGSWRILIKYITKLIEENIQCNWEYYMSLPYNLLKDDWLKTLIFEIPYFLQLGTPSDYEEFKYFESIFNPKD